MATQKSATQETSDETKAALAKTVAATKTVATSTALLSLFNQPGAGLVQVKPTDRLNMPAMLKPGDFPIDAVLQGEIVKFIDSPVTTIKGKLIWLKLAGGKEITFPCTGVVRSALAQGVEADDKKGLQSALEKHAGKVLTLKRGLDSISKKYSSEGNVRQTYMFEVFVSDAPKINS